MKLAVLFPGIGYHSDKPLFYYTKKVLKAEGYEIKEVKYENLPHVTRGDRDSMSRAYGMAHDQVWITLEGTDFSQYEKVVKQLSLLLVDTVRLEDRVYSLDENGGFGIILTCDREGTKIVEGRIRKKLDDPKWFEGVSDKQIRTEVKIGYLQYDKAKYNRNANDFKEDVEEEVNYDM